MLHPVKPPTLGTSSSFHSNHLVPAGVVTFLSTTGHHCPLPEWAADLSWAPLSLSTKPRKRVSPSLVEESQRYETPKWLEATQCMEEANLQRENPETMRRQIEGNPNSPYLPQPVWLWLMTPQEFSSIKSYQCLSPSVVLNMVCDDAKYLAQSLAWSVLYI